jgi:hypothetical protein
MSRWVSNTSPTSSCVPNDSTSSASRQNGFVVRFIVDGVPTARTKGFSKFFTTGLMKHVTTV